MQRNLYPGKPRTRAKLGAGLVPHLLSKKEPSRKAWYVSLGGDPILPRKKVAGFIVLEGLDGSGQSTQANLLKDFLIEKGYKVLLTKEPTKDSEAGKKIREALDRVVEIGSQQLQELFVEDRREHLEKVIIPALKESKIVISDRYFFSSFAYGAGSGVDLEWLIKINSQFLMPDLTFILQVRPEICLERIEKRGDAKTLFEEKEKLAKVWQVYKILPNRFKNVYIIDGEKSIKEVFEEVKNLALSKLNL